MIQHEHHILAGQMQLLLPPDWASGCLWSRIVSLWIIMFGLKFWQVFLLLNRGSWQARLSISFRMSRILRWMHQRGLCHSDLSPKNFLVNVKNAQTTLIDCDGLVVPGIQPPSVLGTPQCMAPEIVMGKSTPSG